MKVSVTYVQYYTVPKKGHQCKLKTLKKQATIRIQFKALSHGAIFFATCMQGNSTVKRYKLVIIINECKI